MDGIGGIKMGGMRSPGVHLYSPYRSWKGQMRRMKTGFSMSKKVSNPLAPVKVGKLSGTIGKIVG